MIGETVLCRENCNEHQYMVEVSETLKAHEEKYKDDFHDLKENVIRLTESLENIKEILRELKEYNKGQDKEIRDNSKFVQKAVGVIGSISVVAALSTPILWVVKKMIEA